MIVEHIRRCGVLCIVQAAWRFFGAPTPVPPTVLLRVVYLVRVVRHNCPDNCPRRTAGTGSLP